MRPLINIHMSSLNQRVALITGSTRGIGLGIARTLARKGAKVILNSPPFDPLEDGLFASFYETAHPPAYMEADVSQAEEVATLFERIEADFGRLDILVNNAGTSQAKDIFEITDTDWRRIMETNLYSG
jgi:3-oxoacyl-[acyl-carrier protein] reductase